MIRNLILLLFAMTCSLNVIAQTLEVKGVVTDKINGETLVGVNISVVGEFRGVSTDVNGGYKIMVNKGDKLEFSFIGMKSVIQEILSAKTLDIALESHSQELEELVVVGYGTSRKRDVTGVITSVKSDELVKQPALSATAAIQGKVPGVQIINTGRPGSSPTVRIRGLGTLNGSTSPLYIVDGMVTSDIANVAASDIESMEILKDASSAAIYGARAANGVIILTTKKGRSGKFTVNYNGYVGVSEGYGGVEMANAQEYVAYQNSALSYDGGDDPKYIDSKGLGDGTDWLDAVTHMGLSQSHDIAVSGGNEKINAYVSLSYKDDESIIKTEDYKRFTLRSNTEMKPKTWLTIRNNMSFSDFRANNVPGSIIRDAYKQEPTFSILDDENQYGSSKITNVGNPVAALHYYNKISQGNRFQDVLSAEIKIIDGLTIRSEFGVDFGWNKMAEYTPEYEVSSSQKNEESLLGLERYTSRHWTWNNSIAYSKVFNDIHRFNATMIMTTEEFIDDKVYGSRKNVPEKPNLWYLNQGDVTTSIANSEGNKSSRVSYILRSGYTFNDRYVVNATIRAEGSSKFPEYNRFGYFPSVGAAWVASEESFLKNVEWLNSLKVRGSFGIIGNDGISSDAFIYTVTSGLDYVFGTDQDRLPGSIEDAVKDRNLMWEKTKEVDFGIDLLLLDHRLSGEIAYYNKLTNGVFLSVENDAALGGGSVLTNKLDIRNSGVELSLAWRDELNDHFSYNIGTNWSFNKNKVLDIVDKISLRAGNFGSGYQITNTIPGGEIGSFYVYESLGVFNSQEEIDAYKIMPNARPGDLMYKDNNGDGKITTEDMVFTGSYQPKAFFGLNAGVQLHGFDLSLDFYGSLGGKIFNALKGDRFGGENISKDIALNAWSPENPNSNIPRPSLATKEPSSYFVEDADFLRLNNVTLGYTLEQRWINKIGVDKVRLYGSIQNVFTLTNYSGFNVEQPGGVLDAGIETDPYPNVRTVMIGLNLSF